MEGDVGILLSYGWRWWCGGILLLLFSSSVGWCYCYFYHFQFQGGGCWYREICLYFFLYYLRPQLENFVKSLFLNIKSNFLNCFMLFFQISPVIRRRPMKEKEREGGRECVMYMIKIELFFYYLHLKRRMQEIRLICWNCKEGRIGLEKKMWFKWRERKIHCVNFTEIIRKIRFETGDNELRILGYSMTN